VRRHLGCGRVAEEGWAGVSDAGQPDAAETDTEGVGGRRAVRAGCECPLILTQAGKHAGDPIA